MQWKAQTSGCHFHKQGVGRDPSIDIDGEAFAHCFDLAEPIREPRWFGDICQHPEVRLDIAVHKLLAILAKPQEPNIVDQRL